MGAIGPCQGAVRREGWGGDGGVGGCWWWGPPSRALRTGFDRLRANGGGRRACGGEWGMRGGDGDAPRRAPALGSRESGNDDGGIPDGERCWCRGAPFECPQGSGQASTGSGRTEGGWRACGGGWRMRGGTETPRAAPLPWVPAFARTTMGVWGLASVAGGRRGVPLGGTGDSRSAPATGCGRVGSAMGVGGGVPHLAAPLGAFAGTTVAGVRVSKCCWCRAGVPRPRLESPLRWGGGVGDARGWWGLPGAPLDTGFRRYADGGCAGRRVLLVSGGSPAAGGTGDSRIAPTTGWGGARGRGSCLRGSDTCGRPFDRLRANGGGKRACGGEEGMRWGGRRRPAPRPGPGFPLSRERR